jgi:hypothetical protein
MSLTIDYVTMPPKSQEVSQIQHGEQVKYDQAQQEAATQMNQQVQQQHEQTVRRAKPENKEFKYGEKDRKGKGKKGSGKGNSSGQENEAEKDQDPRMGGSFFDMKV